jgi:hypothetical protein
VHVKRGRDRSARIMYVDTLTLLERLGAELPSTSKLPG